MTVKEKEKELPHGWKVLADFIPHGQPNAITMNNIIDILGIKDARTFHTIIEQLIVKHGYVILASKKEPRGYYIPATQDEFNNGIMPIKETRNSFDNRVQALYRNWNKAQEGKQ